MSRNAKKTNCIDASVVIATSAVPRRKRQTNKQAHDEGYDTAVRKCAEALLLDGNDREYIADVFGSVSIPFPSTDDTIWDVSWAFDDWETGSRRRNPRTKPNS